MRGYLGLQAARSIGSVETLSPRLPSIFEPAGDNGPLEVIAEATRAGILHPAHSAKSVSERAMKADRSVTSRRRASDTDQGQALEKNAGEDEISPRIPVEGSVNDGVPVREYDPLEIETVAAQTPDEAMSSHPYLDIKSVERRGSPITLGDESASNVVPYFRQGITPAEEVHVRKRTAIESMGIIERRATVEARPSIRVNIGRIDVRAVAEKDPPRPAREQPNRPKLSLEEYLKKGRDGIA